MELSAPHKAQVIKFVSYFKGKRERLISDRESEKCEFKTDRLSDDQAIFNKMDVEELLDTYHAQTVGCIREAMEEFINLSALYVSQVLLQAQQSDLVVDGGDLSTIDDHNKADQIAAMVLKGVAPVQPTKRTNTLPTLAPPSPSGASADQPQKLQQLEEEHRQMLDRYQLMQSQVAELLKERSALTSELEKLGGQAAAATAAAAAASAASVLPERLGDSSQFKELKVILKKKSDEVKELRKRLFDAGLALPGEAGGVDLVPEDE